MHFRILLGHQCWQQCHYQRNNPACINNVDALLQFFPPPREKKCACVIVLVKIHKCMSHMLRTVFMSVRAAIMVRAWLEPTWVDQLGPI